MPNNTSLIFLVSDPKNWRDASKETEEQYAERRRREDRIERLWNRRTLFETIQWNTFSKLSRKIQEIEGGSR